MKKIFTEVNQGRGWLLVLLSGVLVPLLISIFLLAKLILDYFNS